MALIPLPRGETTLQEGDVLVFVAEGAARQEVLRLCGTPSVHETAL